MKNNIVKSTIKKVSSFILRKLVRKTFNEEELQKIAIDYLNDTNYKFKVSSYLPYIVPTTCPPEHEGLEKEDIRAYDYDGFRLHMTFRFKPNQIIKNPHTDTCEIYLDINNSEKEALDGVFLGYRNEILKYVKVS